MIGAAYFEKLAFDNKWIGETARVVQGGLAGLALVYAGIRFARAGYGLYGQVIAGCGAAILYVSTYAAFNFYRLIDRPAAFAEGWRIDNDVVEKSASFFQQAAESRT